ncbi:hypothetical protein RB594_009192 [Gaeumannomyces avenae]
MGAFASIWQTVAYVVSFWYIKLFGWWRSQPPKALWMARLRNATTYEDWEAAALQLDKLHGFDLWRETSQSKHYDWALIKDRLQLLHDTRVDPTQHHRLPNLIRSGLVRNLGNITSPKLYNCSFAGTKLIIEEYIAQVIFAIDDFLAAPITATSTSPSRQQPTSPAVDEESCDQPTDDQPSRAPGAAAVSTGGQAASADAVAPRPAPTSPALSMQAKMTFIHDTRQAFGRTSLILQGGSIFGMCHLGVVKALFLRGLLPQVITGTAVGALIAALIAVHTDEELPGVLSGEAIDLSAFTPTSGKSTPPAADADSSSSVAGSIAAFAASVLYACAPLSSSSTRRWMTLLRRLRRFTEKGYFLDVDVLERCVRDNVGELTFQEAFRRTGRVLNITVATAEQGGVPTVLNHITSPHVLIWTAAAASNADFPSLYGRETQLLCKRPNGEIERWGPANAINFRHWTEAAYGERNSPLRRIAELFNVNNFVISQARPYVVPFLRPDMHGPTSSSSVFGGGGGSSATATASAGAGLATSTLGFFLRLAGLEARHRLRQLDQLGLLPTSIRRFLVDDRVPGGGSALTLVPEVRASDFARLLEVPTRDALGYWIHIGEKSVWPALSALEVRCAIETKLDWAYRRTRRMSTSPPLWQDAAAATAATQGGTGSKGSNTDTTSVKQARAGKGSPG